MQNILVKSLKNKIALKYGLGNILNTVMLLLLLPAIMRINPEAGTYAATGLLISQIFAIFANYSFPIVTPRTLSNFKQFSTEKLLIEIFTYQAILGGGVALFMFFLFESNEYHKIISLASFTVGYSTVLQWQWFHIVQHETRNGQDNMLIMSRLAIISMELALLFNFFSPTKSDVKIFFLIIFFSMVPIYPTVKLIARIKINTPLIELIRFKKLICEMNKGKHLFLASLLSSVYVIGPSVLIAMYSPLDLVEMQQFDRFRISMTGMTGMVLSIIYPILLKSNKVDFINLFKRHQNSILVPSLFISVLLILVVPFLPKWNMDLFQELHIPFEALILSFVCALAASASNFIALTFLHPLNNDKTYRRIIMVGVGFYLLFAAIIVGFFYEKISLLLMFLVAAVEVIILIELWRASFSIARKISR